MIINYITSTTGCMKVVKNRKTQPIKRGSLFLSFLYITLLMSSFSLAQTPDTLLIAQWQAKCIEQRTSKPELALVYIDSAVILSKKIKNSHWIAMSFMNKGSVYYYMSNYPKAIQYTEQALQVFKKHKNNLMMARALTNLGNYYNSLGNYTNALNHFLGALDAAKLADDKSAQAYALASIGGVYRSEGSYDEAIEYYLQAKDLNEKTDNKGGLVMTMNNIGAAYLAMERYDEALAILEDAMQIRIDLKDRLGFAYTLNQIGEVFTKQEQYADATHYIEWALSIYQENETLSGLARTMGNLADIKLKQSEYDSVVYYAAQAYQYSIKIGAKEEAKRSSGMLANAYSNKARFKEAFEYQRLYTMYTDSLLNEQSARQLASLRTNYELEQQKSEIELLTKEADYQQIVNTALLAGLLFFIAGITILIYGYKGKQKANEALASKNLKIQLQNEEIEKQNDILKHQAEELQMQTDNLREANNLILDKNDLLESQKEEMLIQAENIQEANRLIVENNGVLKKKNDIIASKNRNITDSIHYASIIQGAILPPTELLNKWFKEYFILYRPRDIVSGDFYWFREFKHKTGTIVITATADCTGHGVPGAFMSMLGVSLLNEIISKYKTTDYVRANLILNQLRRLVKRSLHQTSHFGKMQDGMDMALCIFNKETKVLQFSGAFHSLFIARTGELIEIKGNRMPIGIYVRDNMPFDNHVLQLQDGDVVYTFTDGIVDQIGGENTRKLMLRQLKENLTEIYAEPLEYQKQKLDEMIEKWRSPQGERDEMYEQVDDILVLGFKV